MNKFFLSIAIGFLIFSSNQIFAQTQSEIEQLLNEDTRTKKENKKYAKELAKKEKVLKGIDKKEKVLASSKGLGEITKFGFSKLIKLGKKENKNANYYGALDYFELAFEKAKRKNKKIKSGLLGGSLSLKMRGYKLAERFYEGLLNLNKNHKKYPLIEFEMANTYKYLAKYDTAIAMYSKFLKLQTENDKLHSNRKQARLEKEGAVFALNLKNNDSNYTLENAGLNVNGALQDFGPELKENKLFFSKIYTDKFLDSDKKSFSKIYYSEIYDDKFNVFQDFSNEINQSKMHIGNPSFSTDGNTVYFTECIQNDDFESQCKIMMSEKVDDVWQKAIELNSNINQENSSNTQPQIVKSPSGITRLFFVSDRARSRGGKDIWYSDIDDEGNFSRAKNLAYPFNTSFDEVSPFYHAQTNTLYFSSNGHVSIGGFDVFKVENYFQEEDNEEDYEVKNLGLPINSSVDDYDFILNKTEELGFLSSNRIKNYSEKSETCCDDIFVLKSKIVNLYLTGKVYADNNSTRLEYSKADLILYNNTTNEKLDELKTKNDGSFIAKIEKDNDYKILAITDDFKNEEIIFSTQDIKKSDTLQYDIFLKERNLENHLIAKIYYQFDESKLREDAPDSLKKVINFMNIYPDVIVEVASHTDSKGTAEYNLKLSEKRSLAVKNYLIYQAKINSNKLVNKWYGETKPVAENTNKDGSDNPKGRDLNRRTEFRVIGTLDKKN